MWLSQEVISANLCVLFTIVFAKNICIFVSCCLIYFLVVFSSHHSVSAFLLYIQTGTLNFQIFLL